MFAKDDFTVSQISILLKKTIEVNFSSIWIKGEVSGFKEQASGHLYFNLKDEDSLLKAVCWKTVAQKHNIKIKDGMLVRCFGALTTFKSQSVYQIQVNLCEDIGSGDLLQIIEKRKKILEEEGLFNPSRKKKLPKYPKTIGIITSPTGAVIRDMLHRISDRFPTKILLWPVMVQGDMAASQIIEAINGMDQFFKPDVLIVARGGGSIEDLMPFNDEGVVRAVAQCSIPIISAVGHETDTTLIDYAADQRAPTPTAAAEFAVLRRDQLKEFVYSEFEKVEKYTANALEINKLKLDRMKIISIENSFGFYAQRLDYAYYNLQNMINKFMLVYVNSIDKIKLKSPEISYEKINNLYSKIRMLIDLKMHKMEANYSHASMKLESNSYDNILNKGFAFITNKDGKSINSKNIAITQNEIHIDFKDGDVVAFVERQIRLL